MLLFIPPNNRSILNDSVKNQPDHIEVFLINNRMSLIRTGLYVHESTGYQNNKGTLIDGEYIIERDLYLAFDLLFYKGDDYRASGKVKI